MSFVTFYDTYLFSIVILFNVNETDNNVYSNIIYLFIFTTKNLIGY